jgi:glycerol-3-phosphate acyltransferase PlsX
VFLGLDGIVIKSHGGTDPTGFAAAVDLGYDMVKHDLLAKIRESLEASIPSVAAGPPGEETHA